MSIFLQVSTSRQQINGQDKEISNIVQFEKLHSDKDVSFLHGKFTLSLLKGIIRVLQLALLQFSAMPCLPVSQSYSGTGGDVLFAYDQGAHAVGHLSRITDREGTDAFRKNGARLPR
ncbi:MAG: hypothetical protein Q7U64_12465 [Desulfocapsaceae bacterium]|nr:hypothetical protein [Desulfocapsaceae bacterium]